MEYCAGFLFKNIWNYDPCAVALIEKIKPEWQQGLLNGIGGKIEKGETPLEAQIREFKEETGEYITQWDKFAILKSNLHGGIVHFFVARNDGAEIETTTQEKVGWYNINWVQNKYAKVVPNLRFLIPMAYNFNGTVFEINELEDGKSTIGFYR